MNIIAISCRTNTGEVAEIPVRELFDAYSNSGVTASGTVPKSDGKKYTASGISVNEKGEIFFNNYDKSNAVTGIAQGIIAFDASGRLITIPIESKSSTKTISTTSQSPTVTSSTENLLPFFTDNSGNLADTDILNDSGNYAVGGPMAFWKWDIYGSSNISQGADTDGYRINGKLVVSFDSTSGELTIGNAIYTTTNIQYIKTESVSWTATGGGTITDVAEATSGTYTLIKPAENGTYATREWTGNNYWKLDGNALTASKGLGTTTAQDWTLIHESDTIATIKSTGLQLDVLSNESTDVDKFLVSNAGLIKYRNGTQLLSDIGAFASPSGLTTNYVTKWNGTALTNSLIFDNGSSVSIGTATPFSNSKLTLSGASGASIFGIERINPIATGGLGAIGFKTADASTPWVSAITSTSGSTTGTAHISFLTGTASASPFSLTERMRISDTGSVGISTTTPSEKLEVNGNVKATTGIFTDLTTNYLPKHTSGGLANSLIYDNGTNVGIGTSTPLRKLDVIDATGAYFRHSATANTAGAFRMIGGTYTGNGVTMIMSNAINGNNQLSFGGGTSSAEPATSLLFFTGTYGSLGAGTERMRISDTGSVGIGTTSLTGISINNARKVTGATGAYGYSHTGQIQSDVTSFASLIQSNVFQITGATTPNVYAFIANQGTVSGTITNLHGFYVNSNMISATNSYGFRGLIPSGSNRYNNYHDGTAQNHFRGNVGIGLGSTTPTHALHVIDTGGSQLKLERTGVASILFGISAQTANSSGDFFFEGTQASQGYAFRSRDASNNPVTSLGIDRAGNVGIGTFSPAYKFDVQGTGHFTGAVTFDTVPSSLQDATTSNHLVRYSQFIAATAIKYLPTAVKTVSLTNITLSGTQTVNGVALVDGDRILVAGQTAGAENGVRIVSAGSWTRATDSDTDGELRGYIVSVSNGTYAGYKYINTNSSAITVGTTAITYSEFSNNIETDPAFTAWIDTTRTANTFWAAPNGSNGAATWRTLVAADVPTLNQSTTGSAATLNTSRNIAITGDLSWNVDFNGSAAVTAVGTLATVTDSGSGTFLKITTNTKGLVTGTVAVAQADITGLLGSSSITNTMLSDSGVTAGTYRSVTVNAKGIVTGGTNPTTLAEYGITDVYTKTEVYNQTESDGRYVDITTSDQEVTARKYFYAGIKFRDVLSTLASITRGTYSKSGGLTQALTSSAVNIGLSASGFTAISNGDNIKALFGDAGLLLGTSLDYEVFASERLQVNGNIRYNTLLKPNNIAGTSGQFLGTSGTQDVWTTLTASDISDLSSYTGFDARYFTETEANGRFVDFDTDQSINGIKSFASHIYIGSSLFGEGIYNIGGTNRIFAKINSGTGLVFSGGARGTHFAEDEVVYMTAKTAGVLIGTALNKNTFASEKLQVDGNIRYNTLLKPNNIAGTSGQFLGTNGTQDAWATLTTSDISNLSSWTGSTSITTLGTIATGVWSGTTIEITKGGTGLTSLGTAGQLLKVNSGATALEYFTPTYISTNQTITLSGIITGSGTTAITTSIADGALSIAKTSGLQTALDGKQATLGGTGIVKSTGGTISYLTDNSSNWNTAYGWGNHASGGYLTTSTAASTYQTILPSGTSGQFLIRNASAELEFFNLELEPTRLTKNKIAVGDSANYLSDYDNLEFLESRLINILKVDDSTKAVSFGMYGASSNSFISASGGSLTVRGDNGLIFSNFAGGGTLALTVDNFGNVGVTPLGTGGGSTPTLSSTYIGYGSSGNALTGTSNFTYDAIKTAVYFNDSANYLYVGKSVSVSDMFEITAVGTRGIQLNTDTDIVIKNSGNLYLGAGGDNERVHIGRGASYNDANHYLVMNGETFSFSMDNIPGWGDSNSESTPQVGDKVLFNVVDVGGNKRFVPQKINKKLFSSLTSGDTVLTL